MILKQLVQPVWQSKEDNNMLLAAALSMVVLVRILHFLSIPSCQADGGLHRPCLLQTLFGEVVHEQQSPVFQCAVFVHWYQGFQTIPKSTGSPDISISTGRKIILKLCLHIYDVAS